MDFKKGTIDLTNIHVKYENKNIKIRLLKKSATSNVYKDVDNTIVIKK